MSGYIFGGPLPGVSYSMEATVDGHLRVTVPAGARANPAVSKLLDEWRDQGAEIIEERPENRWAAFTDDELVQLSAWWYEAANLPGYRPGHPARTLGDEISAELERRRAT